MKKVVAVLLAILLSLSVAACGGKEQELANMEPEVSQMKAICELAVMDCYYHNVANLKRRMRKDFYFGRRIRNLD